MPKTRTTGGVPVVGRGWIAGRGRARPVRLRKTVWKPVLLVIGTTGWKPVLLANGRTGWEPVLLVIGMTGWKPVPLVL